MSSYTAVDGKIATMLVKEVLCLLQESKNSQRYRL